MYIISLRYVRPLAEVDAHLAAHVEWLKAGYLSGHFLASGRKVPREGGVILARAANRAALDELLAQDPFALAGVAHYDLIEFAPTMAAAGLEQLIESN